MGILEMNILVYRKIRKMPIFGWLFIMNISNLLKLEVYRNSFQKQYTRRGLTG